MSEPPPRLSEWELLKRFYGWLRPHRRLLYVAMVLVPVVAACAVAQPRILGLAIDEYMLKGDLEGLGMAALLFLGVIVIEYVFGSAQLYLMMLVGTRAVGSMRQDIYRHVTALGQCFFDRRLTGALERHI